MYNQVVSRKLIIFCCSGNFISHTEFICLYKLVYICNDSRRDLFLKKREGFLAFFSYLELLFIFSTLSKFDSKSSERACWTIKYVVYSLLTKKSDIFEFVSGNLTCFNIYSIINLYKVIGSESIVGPPV